MKWDRVDVGKWKRTSLAELVSIALAEPDNSMFFLMSGFIRGKAEQTGAVRLARDIRDMMDRPDEGKRVAMEAVFRRYLGTG